MSIFLENSNSAISEKISRIFGKPIIVHLWVMSENTPDTPDWQERDEELSLCLIQLFLDLTRRKNLEDASFSIGDRIDDETKPHYAVGVQIGDKPINQLPSKKKFTRYSAIDSGHEHLGDIETIVSFFGTDEEHDDLAQVLFDQYCVLLDKYYPEYKTTYFDKPSISNEKSEDSKRIQ